MENVDNKPWKVESLRLTSFLKNDFNSSPLENWVKTISKNEPLSINKSVNHFQGLAQIGSSMLNLSWNTNRIDLLLNSNAPTIENNIGNCDDITKLMNDILFVYFNMDNCPISKRLALGIILYLPVSDVLEAVEVLQPKLKSVTDLKGTSDFLFRINRPIQSKSISDLKLNRLMTWSIAHLQIINLPINIPQPAFNQQTNIANSLPELICRLEMDFNTIVNEEVEILAEQQKQLANELLTEAMKVAKKGEFGIEW